MHFSIEKFIFSHFGVIISNNNKNRFLIKLSTAEIYLLKFWKSELLSLMLSFFLLPISFAFVYLHTIHKVKIVWLFVSVGFRYFEPEQSKNKKYFPCAQLKLKREGKRNWNISTLYTRKRIKKMEHLAPQSLSLL